MAQFLDAKYETDGGLVIFVRLSPEEIAVAGTPPAADADINIHAYSSGSRDRFGFHARGVNLRRTIGTGDDTFNKYRRLTLLTATALDSAAYQIGATVTIGGVAYIVANQFKELTR